MVPLKLGTYNRQIYRDGKYSSGYQGLGEGRNGELLFSLDVSVWED